MCTCVDVPCSHLKQVLRLFPEGSLVLIGSLPDSRLQMSEEGPHQVIAVADVAMQRERAICYQEPAALFCVTVHWCGQHNESTEHGRVSTGQNG